MLHVALQNSATECFKYYGKNGGEYIIEIVLDGDRHVKTTIDTLWNC